MKQAVAFFSNTNLYIALGAVLACYGTVATFNLPIDKNFYPFIFFATWCSYSLHWYFSNDGSLGEKEEWSIKNKKMLLVQTAISLIGGLYFLSLLSKPYWIGAIPAVLLSLLYTAPKIPHQPFIQLRRFVVAKTLYLALAWHYATVLLPMHATNFSSNEQTFHFAWHRFLVIFMVCLFFDLKDKKVDMSNGIKSMLYQFSNPIVSVIILFLSSMALVSAARLFTFIPMPLGIANVVTVLLIIILHKRTMNTNDQLWYFYMVDGWMFLSGLVALVSSLLI